jgi:NTP pyrophosphatase (non-canonical NTP hydrolase)
MTFDEYQERALTTLHRHPNQEMDTTISAMGVSGEAGEMLDKWKKIVAYHEGTITPEDLQDLSKEIGDVLWYLAVFADNLGLSFDVVAQQNLEKLASRQARNVIKGAGDNR